MTETDTTPETFTAYRLANMVDVRPDTAESIGANFLLGVQADLLERWKWNAENDTAADIVDAVAEIADSAVPVYTADLWATFVDLGAWSEDVTELGPIKDMDSAARTALYLIADRLCHALLAEWETGR